DHEPDRARRLALLHQRDAGDDEHDREHVAAEPEEPADERLDRVADRAGEPEVDRQPAEHAGYDEADADELVLAATHRLTQLALGLSPPTPGTGRRGVLDAPARPLRRRARSGSRGGSRGGSRRGTRGGS